MCPFGIIGVATRYVLAGALGESARIRLDCTSLPTSMWKRNTIGSPRREKAGDPNLTPYPVSVCVLLLQDLLQSCSRAVSCQEFITTSPLRHRHSENMTRSPVPKPPATTSCSPDSPARRHDRQDGGGLCRRSLRHAKDSQVLRARQGFGFASPLRNRCREHTMAT